MKSKQIDDLGFRTFKTVAERDAYKGLRFEGLRAVVHADSNTENNGVYALQADLITWQFDSSLEDEAYDYSTWNGDTLAGATKNALADKFKSVDDLIDLLAPPRANTITNLTLNGTTTYDAKLPTGLTADWYAVATDGSTVSNVVIDNTFTLSSNDFRAGALNRPDTYGQLLGYVNDTVVDTHDLTVDQVGITGIVEVTSIDPHENFWTKADGRLNITQTLQGYEKYEMEHTEAGKSAPFTIYYDDVAAAPTFSTAASATVGTKNSKWLSGIEFFGLNSTFLVDYTVDDLFNKVYRTSGATQMLCIGGSNINVDPTVTPNYLDQFIITDETFTLNSTNQASNDPTFTVRARKPYGGPVDSTFSVLSVLGLGINTYGVVSTTTAESFQDEDKRLVAGTTTTFDSTLALPNGEAQVKNGILSYGNVDYTGKTGDQRYDRRISKVSASNGSIQFTGITATEFSNHGSGSLNAYIWLETENKYFDITKPFGQNNGTGDGSSLANSLGGLDSRSGSTINFTFGTSGNTANNSNQYRLILVFRDATKTITSITTS